MSKKEKCKHERIPIFIGVTGHRDVRTDGDDEQKMKAAVKKAMDDICKKREYTDFILLTALAEGADRIAAEAIIEMAEEQKKRKRNRAKRNIRFAAILPMNENEYFTEGELENIKKKFLNSEHCAFVYTMPDQQTPLSDGKISYDDLRYRETARFISDNTLATIALWDGLTIDSNSAGTGVAVRDSLHGKAYHLSNFPRITIPETRPIYHIYCPRRGEKPCAKLDYKMRCLFPEPLLETGEKWFSLNGKSLDEKIALFASNKLHDKGEEREKKFRQHIEAIDCYNRDVVKYEKFIDSKKSPLNQSVAEWNAASYVGKLKNDSGQILPTAPHTDICEEHYMTADALAQKYQKKRMYNIFWIVWIAGIAYILLNIFSDLYSSPLFLVLYFAFLTIAVLIHLHEKKNRYHSRFVDYRALAEGLRVQYFWFCADIRDTDTVRTRAATSDKEDFSEPALTQNYYLRRQKGEIEWIRLAIRSINLLALAEYHKIDYSADRNRIKAVSDLWLGRMDFSEENEKGKKLWYNPTYRLKANGQVGYYLNNSLCTTDDIHMKKRPAPNGNSSDRSYKKALKKDTVCLSRKFRLFRLFEKLAQICLAVSMLLAVVLTTALLVFPSNPVVQCCADPAMFIVGLLPILAMIFRELSGQMGYEEDVDRYSWYYNAFKRAIIEIDEVYNTDDMSDENKTAIIKEILFEIGEESLIENADWVMLNAKRVPEVPSN